MSATVAAPASQARPRARARVSLGRVGVYAFLTFGALLWLFQAGEALFHTGWFVESLATQTLVIFVIRTAGPPLGSRPGGALTATTLGVVLTGMVLPFTRTPSASLLPAVLVAPVTVCHRPLTPFRWGDRR